MTTLQLGLFLAAVSVLVGFLAWSGPLPHELKVQLRKFGERVDALDRAVQTIQRLSLEYFLTLQDSGGSRLSQVFNSLKNARDLSESLAARRELDDLQQLLSYVYVDEGKGEPPQIAVEMLRDDIPHLTNWKDQVSESVTKIVDNVYKASTRFDEVGRKKKERGRPPTSVLLGELREFIKAALA